MQCLQYPEFALAYLTVDKFYKNKFALAIDLRATRDVESSGQGKKIVNTQNGVLLEIKKKAYSVDLSCSVFVVSDGWVNFKQVPAVE